MLIIVVGAQIITMYFIRNFDREEGKYFEIIILARNERNFTLCTQRFHLHVTSYLITYSHLKFSSDITKILFDCGLCIPNLIYYKNFHHYYCISDFLFWFVDDFNTIKIMLIATYIQMRIDNTYFNENY